MEQDDTAKIAIGEQITGAEGAFTLGERAEVCSPARAPRKKKRPSKMERREHLIAFLFILPPVIGFLIFTAISMGATFIFGFQYYWSNREPPESKFVGFDNYVTLFSNMLTAGTEGNTFLKDIGNTLFLMLSVPASILLGLALAGLLRLGDIKGSKVFQILYYLPAVSSAVALNIVWRYIFLSNGVLNGLFHTSTPWLTDDMLVKVAIVFKNSLNAMGGAMILYLAGMLNVPKELYEASSLDGAGRLRQFFTITFPMITPVTFYLLITGVIGGLQSYTDSQVFATNGGADTIVYFIWENQGGNAMEYGIASAASIVLSVAIMIVTIVQFKFSNKWVYEE